MASEAWAGRGVIRVGDIGAGDVLLRDGADPMAVVRGPEDFGHEHAFRFAVLAGGHVVDIVLSSYDSFVRVTYPSGVSHVVVTSASVFAE